MHSWTGWKISRDLAGDYLAKAFGDRQKEGREAAQARRAEADCLRAAGRAERAAMLEEIEWKKSWAFARRLRRREEEDAKRYGYKLGAALRKNERLQLKASCPATLFRHFEFGQDGLGSTKGSGRTRDLFFEYIPRGFSSGTGRNYKREKKRSNARTARWKSGEFGRKVRYIEREDALEEVEGNVLSNMGEDMAERVACSRQIEQLETVDRDNAGVYRHLIIALPHELSPEGRAALLAELVQPLRDLNLPFDAALHKPDRDGDQRNFHAHLLVSLRPMQRVGDHEWTFAAFKRRSLETPAGLSLQRRFVARAFNRALAQEKIETRWTHLSRAARGQASPGNTKKLESETRRSRREAAASAELEAAQADVKIIAWVSAEVDAIDAQFVKLGRAEVRFEALLESMMAEAAAIRDAASATFLRLDETDVAITRMVDQVKAWDHSRTPDDRMPDVQPAVAEPSGYEPQPATNGAMQEAERMREEQAGAERKKSKDAGHGELLASEYFGRWFDPSLPNRLGERRRASHEALLELELNGHAAIALGSGFRAVRDAFLSADPQFFVGVGQNREERLYAADPALLKSFAEVAQDRASWAYLDAMIEASPAPSADRLPGLHSLMVRTPDLGESSSEQAASMSPDPDAEPEEDYSVVDQHVARTGLKPGHSR
jgi:hypothetical protein